MSAKKVVPIWEKKLLTLEECTAYTGIGIGKLKAMTQVEDCSFAIWMCTAGCTQRFLKFRNIWIKMEANPSFW